MKCFRFSLLFGRAIGWESKRWVTEHEISICGYFDWFYVVKLLGIMFWTKLLAYEDWRALWNELDIFKAE